ncbi:PREDICTED: uncharacterized protein LOC103322602 [Prunus mume]|uniref:Uncharacterized protein LOC103322602 n=1 Tax=Prunus mume TaxID=102107 RepID=A0ABM0NCJ9_PRUMU|nr:PREDICTED: uncharacterized protein LOC103322602 [Prunus mume]
MEHRIDHVQPEQGRNPHPVNALNDIGALQRMIREMMEPEARRGDTSIPRFQGESEPIPIECQEDWTKEYEEEQLDYEPSVDDQIGLLETEEQENGTEEYEEEQMKYDGELDEETKVLVQNLRVYCKVILPEKFKAAEEQENTLEGKF